MNLSVKDSTMWHHPEHVALNRSKDNAIRVGIVRQERVVADGSVRWIVEVWRAGRQVPMSCVVATRFGGAHNFEEYRVRAWQGGSDSSVPNAPLLPAASSTYDLRSGDVVIVAQLDGDGREGVILGGINHPARDPETISGETAYVSRYQGLETKIDDDGTYTVTYSGKPINDEFLSLPPAGQKVPPPEYNTEVAGSYFQFDNLGSYTVTDNNNQIIKIKKQTGTIVIASGDKIINIGARDPFSLQQDGISVQSDKLTLKVEQTNITSEKKFAVKSEVINLQGKSIAIWNGSGLDLITLLDMLIKALGTLVVTSPVGTCTPLMTAPTWKLVEEIQKQIKKINEDASSLTKFALPMGTVV